MMDVNTARLLRLIKRPGVYIYIRPVAGEWPGIVGHTDGIVWQVTVEQRKLQWEINKHYGDDLEKVLQEILDELAPSVKRRRPPTTKVT